MKSFNLQQGYNAIPILLELHSFAANRRISLIAHFCRRFIKILVPNFTPSCKKLTIRGAIIQGKKMIFIYFFFCHLASFSFGCLITIMFLN